MAYDEHLEATEQAAIRKSALPALWRNVLQVRINQSATNKKSALERMA